MRLADTTARTVEALHIVVLLVFGAWMPFIFHAAPEDQQPTPSTLSRVEPPAATPPPAAHPASASPGEAYLSPVRPSPMSPWSGAQLDIVPETSASGQLPSVVAALQGKSGACKGDEAGRLTMLPFLIALIGGGVFSLEAFEAFPML
mmetsp:Transcript_18189/g.45887  ORF Transcript_18189/g.45887 Transcript_18189/m.45887 type:complete len:147 (+) Transcript_18189:97-537(+)